MIVYDTEGMTDEEIDRFYRPKKSNSRKSLAPLFVYEILTKYSSEDKHLRLNDIISILNKYPYEISIERKALGRLIHNLVDALDYAVYQDHTGVWVNQSRRRSRVA